MLETAIRPALRLSLGNERQAWWDWAAAKGGVTQGPHHSAAMPGKGGSAQAPHRLLDGSGGPGQRQHSTHGLQEALLDQAIKVIPDIIGMGDTREMKAKLKVGELGSIGKVRAGNK